MISAIKALTATSSRGINWLATLGDGDTYEYFFSGAVNSLGEFCAVGATNDDDILIAKYNSSGTIQWQRTLGGADVDYGNGIAIDSGDNVYVTGRTRSQGAGSDDIVIAKYNSSGTIQWQRTLGGASTDVGFGIAIDSGDNVCITGYTNSQGAGSFDFIIVKYNSSGTIQWQRTLGGASSDVGYGIAIDSGDNVYVTGSTNSQGAGSDDIVIAKYNSSGTIQWQRTLGGASFDYGWKIAIDSGDNVYVTGSTNSQGAGSDDIVIAKYNSSGTIQWQRTLGGASGDRGYEIAIDSGDNVYVTGYSSDPANSVTGVLIVKYNSSGTIQWQRIFFNYSLDIYAYSIIFLKENTFALVGDIYRDSKPNGSYGHITLLSTEGIFDSWTYTESLLTNATSTLTSSTSTLTDSESTLTSSTSTLTDAASSYVTSNYSLRRINPEYWINTTGRYQYVYNYGIAVDSNKNIYAVGETNATDTNYNILLTKYSSKGFIQWQRTLGGASYDYGWKIVVDSNNDVYVTGSTRSQGAGSDDIVIAKYNSSGTIQWQRTLGGASSDGGYGIAIDSGDNVYVTGYTSSEGAGSDDIVIAKYNSSGTIQWQRTLGGASSDVGYGIAIDSGDNVYVTGSTNSQGAGSDDIVIAKYNSSGTIQWQRTLGGASSDVGYGIAIDSGDNVYVTGYTNSEGAGNFDFIIVKYNSSGTIQWQRTLGGANNDYGYGIAIDSGDNVYVTGSTRSQGAGNDDIVIAKYNSSGTIQWQRTLGGASTDVGFGIAIDSGDNVYVTGYTISQGFTIKLPSDGTGTGTYEEAGFVYQVSTLTSSTSTLTDSTSTLTDSTSTLTSTTSTLTSSVIELYETLTEITP
jgi:uncharacterized delta-60 repeat protein